MSEVYGENDPRTNELVKLQREYRNMEINRRAYAEESQSVLRKQQTSIDKLKKDNEAIKNDIALLLRGSNKQLSQAQQEFIQQLTDQIDKYAQQIDFERGNIQTMEEQIQLVRQKTLQQRRAMGGVNASKENHYMILKQIHILENRLDKSLIKFNEAISHNKGLREQIDDLRRERVVFENIYRKMERDLQERKKHMAEIIELSNQAYEQRDTFQMEVAAIEQANRKENEEYEDQMLTLGGILENELQLPSVGGTSKTRLPSRFGASGLSPKGLARGSSSGLFSSTDDLSKTGGDMAPPSEIDFHERAQNFEEAFNKIKSATGITDVDELVRTFIKNEEHNFSLFNYVNEQNNEIEKYEEQIQQLKEEELKFAQESGNDVTQHKEILKDLEHKLQNTEVMAEKYEQRCQDLQRITESLKRGMQSIFSKFDFENEEDGSATPVVTEVNMVQLLALIELKANQLLKGYNNIRTHLVAPSSGDVPLHSAAGLDKEQQLESAESEASMKQSQALVSILGVGPKVPMGQELLHVNPPKSEDYRSDDSDEDDDGDTRPLTRDELKHRTMNKLQKRLGGNLAIQNGNPNATQPSGGSSTSVNDKKK